MSLIKLPHPSSCHPQCRLLTLQLKMAKRNSRLHNLKDFYTLYSKLDGKGIAILKSMHMSNMSLSLTGPCKIKANILSSASITTLTDVEGRQNKGAKHMGKLGSWSLENDRSVETSLPWSMPASTAGVTTALRASVWEDV